MMSFAQITLAGTLLQDPEKRFTQNNVGVSILHIAVSMPPRRNQPVPDMVIKVLAWRGLSDAVSVLQQGMVVHVEGRLQINTVTTPEGIQKKMFEIDAKQIHQLQGLPHAIQPVAMNAQNAPAPTAYAPQPQYSQASYTPAPQAQAPYGQHTATAVVAPPPAVNLTELSPDDFLTEDDLPF